MSTNGAAGDRRVDVAIIGAGIVGLATARALLQRYPGLKLAILEKEQVIAQHQTGRNSGVVHSGLYYAPGSLKARLCVEGAAGLRRFCDERGIPLQSCGKVVVAVEAAELPRLEELYRRGTANGVEGLIVIGPERLREIEPHAAGIRALHSPNTSIVDFNVVAGAFAADVQEAGGEILTGHEVVAIARRGNEVVLEAARGVVEARFLISCAGLHADRVAAMSGGKRDPRIVPFRGDYYALRPERLHLVRALIYPVPDPAFPFLGVHTTLRMDGTVWLGPNAVLAFAREGYRRLDISPRDLVDALGNPGFQALARTFWRVGLDEMIRDFSKARFVRAVQRLVPDLTIDDVVPGSSGIRAQALSSDGRLVDDFVFDTDGPIVHVRNAPSPAATSCLAIARTIVSTAEEAFGLEQRSAAS